MDHGIRHADKREFLQGLTKFAGCMICTEVRSSVSLSLAARQREQIFEMVQIVGVVVV